MIRINLAKKKNIPIVQSTKQSSSSASSKSSFSLPSFNFSLGDTSGITAIFVRILIPGAVCFGAYFAFTQYITQQRDIMAAEQQQANLEKDKIQKELNRIAGFEKVKVDLEKNEKILGAKIDTIQKLIANRDFAFRSLLGVSNSLPREVWLNEVTESEKGFEIKGRATDVGLVSDLMFKLGDTQLFKDVSLKGTTQDQAQNQAVFELTARRE